MARLGRGRDPRRLRRLTARPPPATPPIAPPGGRIAAIDALRGVALLGVLVVNLDTEFRVTFFEQFSPHYAGAVDRLVRAAIGLLVEFKAIAIFSMLFGAGLAIQAATLARHGLVPRLLVRRLLVLLAFGLVHLLLVWNGDILTGYALAGLLALPFILAPPAVTLAASAAALLSFLLLCCLPSRLFFPDPAWMARHVLAARHAYGQGGFAETLRFRIAEAPRVGIFDAFVFPRTVGLILFGAWAWNSGAIGRIRTGAGPLARTGWIALVSGLLLNWLDGAGISAPLALPPAIAPAIDVSAPIVLAIGYAALALRHAPRLPPQLLAWIVPVGRMAFTNYIAQSVILGLLFYGYGLGLLGRVGVASGIGLSLAIYTAQALASRWWLRRHHAGPLEWLWRTAMHGHRQPWLRQPAHDPRSP